MDLQELARQIPDYPAFLGVDEMAASTRALAAEFPALVSLRTVGHTRRGDPIELITIRGGERQAFVFGGPHPNEPVGCMAIEFLTRRLCEDEALRTELGYTWHFIKSIDADGMRLNEGWFKGPFTPTQYARHFFRPAPFDQVEWTFPLDYKTLHFDTPMPETEALMRVIDEVRPTLLYSLHNSGFGGVYYYCSGGDAELFRAFHQIPGWFGLSLELGEPEVSFAKPHAPAIYQMISARDSYDHLEQNGVADPAAALQSGASSAEYSEKYGSYFLVAEMPYFDDPRVNDQSPSMIRRRDAILASLDGQDEFDAWIDENLAEARALLQRETPITRAVNAFLSMGREHRQAQRQWVQSAPETDRPASQAEVFSNTLGSHFYRLLILGMVARMLDEEIAAGNTAPQLTATRAAARERLAAQSAALEAGLEYRALPIRSLVGVQVCAGLAAAEYLRDRGPRSRSG